MNLLSVFGVRVMEDLQQCTAAVFETHPVWSNSATSVHATRQQSHNHVWEEFSQTLKRVEIMDNGQLTHLAGIVSFDKGLL